ncbi:MAG: hypothetical protein A3K60_07210 [Euryarchaeota archaeon RBG_19FT_COMBO_56_21]|nr:MAG: hypothetical protein A3K60_07210 [Euryarchaeota archaeon RBG_19FT_COMBO_56_21]
MRFRAAETTRIETENDSALVAFIDFFGLSVPEEAARLLIMELALGAILAASFLMAALRKGAWHHWMMLSAYALDELVAKPLMAQRLMLGVVGDFPYEGTVALPHLALSVTATAFGLITIILGFRFRVKKGWKMFMPAKGKKIHRLTGVIFLVAWFASLALGMRMFFLFYGG